MTMAGIRAGAGGDGLGRRPLHGARRELVEEKPQWGHWLGKNWANKESCPCLWTRFKFLIFQGLLSTMFFFCPLAP